MRNQQICFANAVLLLAACVATLGCGSSAPVTSPEATVVDRSIATDETALKTGPSSKLVPVDVGSTTPAHHHGQFYLAGQPAAEDLAKWKELGVRTVINLRTDQEIDWDEKQVVESLGMSYVSIPFRGPETLTDQTLRQAIAAMGDESRRPVLLHCATSNRTGAIWYAHRIVNDGLAPYQAIEEARNVGLRTAAFREIVDEYLRQELAE